MDLSFSAVILTIGKLFVLMALGYALFLFRIVDKRFVDELSMLLVRVFFPALIISKTIQHFSFSEYRLWWLLPGFAIFFIALGAVIAFVLYPLSGKNFSSKKEFASVCAFQNCGYLPMNLILFTFTGVFRDRLLIYMFLFIVGFNILMWSLLPLVLSGRLKKELSVKSFLNSPVVATIFAILWVAFFGKGTLPAVLAGPVSQIGAASFPIAMLALGAYLACYKAYVPEPVHPVALAVISKLVLLPMIALPLLVAFGIEGDYRFFLFLQAIMPSAVSLVVVGTYTGSDNKFMSSSIFYSHVFSLLTIPLWLAFYAKFFS